MRTKQMDERGILSAGDYLHLPVRLYSRSGGFYRVVKTPEELLKFLRDHYASGARFDVEAVWKYYCEQPGDCAYRVESGGLSARAEAARQMLDPDFVLL